MRLRSELTMRGHAFPRESGVIHAECAKLLGLTDPSTVALVKGRLSHFSLVALVNIATRADLNVRLVVKKSA